MRKLFKFIVFGLLLVTLLAGVVACKGPNNPPEPDSPSNSSPVDPPVDPPVDNPDDPVDPPVDPPIEEPTQFPVTLAEDGLSFTYGYPGEETTVQINEKAIYVDGRLTAEDAAKLQILKHSVRPI